VFGGNARAGRVERQGQSVLAYGRHGEFLGRFCSLERARYAIEMDALRSLYPQRERETA
jgi:hypothetical protein